MEPANVYLPRRSRKLASARDEMREERLTMGSVDGYPLWLLSECVSGGPRAQPLKFRSIRPRARAFALASRALRVEIDQELPMKFFMPSRLSAASSSSSSSPLISFLFFLIIYILKFCSSIIFLYIPCGRASSFFCLFFASITALNAISRVLLSGMWALRR